MIVIFSPDQGCGKLLSRDRTTPSAAQFSVQIGVGISAADSLTKAESEE